MIYVDGLPFSTDDSSSSSSSSSQGHDTLIALMSHPVLISTSSSFSALQEKKFSVSEAASLDSSTQRKCVYVFQREYAAVDPKHVEVVGTDEATTCIGIVIRNRKNGMTSIAHIDSPNVVDLGLTQMLSSLVAPNEDDVLDVHIVGAFEDAVPQHANNGTGSRGHKRPEGYSLPLCSKLVETLGKRTEKFHLQTLHVLKNNTRLDCEGNSYPIFNGLLVETSSGAISPASFDGSTRCPDEIIRRIRVSTSYEDPSLNGRLLETYDTHMDRFVIAPTIWTIQQLHYALMVQELSDLQILLTCSTSPTAEAPDFVENQRRVCEYLIQHPSWRDTFPSKRPRVFERTADGSWTRL